MMWPQPGGMNPWANPYGQAPGGMPTSARYGNNDNLSKLIRSAAPNMPQMRAMTPMMHMNAGLAAMGGPVGLGATLTTSSQVWSQQGTQEADKRDYGTDWFCKCGEINHRSRKKCGKCGGDWVENPASQLEWGDLCKLLKSKGGGSKKKRSRSQSSSSSSRDRKKKKKKKRKKSSSSSDSSSSGKRRKKKRSASKSKDNQTDVVGDGDKPAEQTAPQVNPEIEKAKADVLAQVMKMRDAGLTLDERRKQWRALLRSWHPDKHENKELATAVFQFLQKAKAMINLESD